MNDEAAIDQLKQGNINGLEVLIQRYQAKAVRAAYLITHDRAQAEDIVQSAFIRVYERIGQLRSNQSFEGWFLRSVVNDAVRSASRSARHVPFNPNEGEPFSLAALADGGPGPESLAEQAELREAVWAALQQLPPQQRAMIVERYYLGQSEAEMADKFSIPSGTVKSRLHVARARLQEHLRLFWKQEA